MRPVVGECFIPDHGFVPGVDIHTGARIGVLHDRRARWTRAAEARRAKSLEFPIFGIVSINR
jgi:hypothetical protein